MEQSIENLTANFKAICPECEFEFNIEDPELDEVITCGDCSLNLQITKIDTKDKKVQFELTETDADDWGE